MFEKIVTLIMLIAIAVMLGISIYEGKKGR